MEEPVEETFPAVKQAKPKVTKKAAKDRDKDLKNAEVSRADFVIGEDTTEAPVLISGAAKKRGVAKREIPQESQPEKVVQESQVPTMDIGDDADEEVEVEHTISSATYNSARPEASRPRSQSRVRQPSGQRRRAGSASENERNDPAMRRKLGEITRKYENLHLKYQDLREIGLKESERNFERLKKESDTKTKSGPTRLGGN